MNIIYKNKRKSESYLPHELKTRYYAVLSYRNGNKSTYVCRKYHISKSSLSRWNRKFDGTKESLIDKSHKPLTTHPNAHTEKELCGIKVLGSGKLEKKLTVKANLFTNSAITKIEELGGTTEVI